METSHTTDRPTYRGSKLNVGRIHIAVVAYRFGSFLLRRIPYSLLKPIQRFSASIAAKSSKERRLLVGRHLSRVYGEIIPPKELDKKIHQTFETYARYWVDSARIPRLSDFEIDSGFTVEGFEHIENAMATGIGPILALPHLGGWEWAGRWLICCPKYQVSVVVEEQNPPELFQFLMKYRQDFGMNVIPLGPNAGKQVIKALKANHVVCLLCDRDIEGNGIEVNFFGEKTTVPAGPATLALRTGAHIVPVAVYQQERSHHAVVCPPITAQRSGRLRDNISEITQELVHVFEDLIRAAPEQWHLMQPNWESDHLAIEKFQLETSDKTNEPEDPPLAFDMDYQ